MVSGEQVARWLARLEAGGPEGDREALLALWSLAPGDVDAVEPLLRTLRTSTSRWRAHAARWLGQIETASPEVASALTDAWRDPDEAVSTAAGLAVWHAGIRTAENERYTTHTREERDDLRRIFAAGSLLELYPEEREPLRVLRGAHASESLFVRDRAADALVQLFDVIPSTIDDALLFLDDDYDPVVEHIARALAKQDENLVIPRLLLLLRTGTADYRAGALFALSEPRARINDALQADVVEALIATRVFDDDTKPWREAETERRLGANVAKALALDAPVVVEELRALLGDPSAWVVEQAAQALLSFTTVSDAVREDATRALRELDEKWSGARRGRRDSPPSSGEKDATISELLARLDLPARGWTIRDHWEGDLCAIGILVSVDPHRLVYVSTFSKQPGHYFYALESAPTREDEVFHQEGSAEVTFDELVTVMTEFARRPAR